MERSVPTILVIVAAGPGQGKAGKAGKTGPGQTKPRLGTTGKPAKPKAIFFDQDGNREILVPSKWE